MKYFDCAIKLLVSAEESFDAEKFLREHIEHFPAKLYKYRKCNRNGFDMLKNEYIWADNPEIFDDPIDSKVNHRLRYELPSIHRWLDSHLGELFYYCLPPQGMQERKGAHRLKDYIDAQEHFLDADGKFDAKLARKEMVLELRKLPKEKRDACVKVLNYFQSKEFENECSNMIRTTIDGIVNMFRKTKIIACLTARNDNSVMWENYAAKFSGFCVEYKIDTDKITEDAKVALINLFPVIYRKRIPGINLLPFIKYHFNKSLYKNEYDIKNEMVLLYKQLLYKKYEYSYEEEWRIILNESCARQVDFPFVSAVYAGYNISDSNLKKLKSICKRKGIPLYKQKINMYTNKFSYDQIIWERD